jgi:hypothetical protein
VRLAEVRRLAEALPLARRGRRRRRGRADAEAPARLRDRAAPGRTHPPRLLPSPPPRSPPSARDEPAHGRDALVGDSRLVRPGRDRHPIPIPGGGSRSAARSESWSAPETACARLRSSSCRSATTAPAAAASLARRSAAARERSSVTESATPGGADAFEGRTEEERRLAQRRKRKPAGSGRIHSRAIWTTY